MRCSFVSRERYASPIPPRNELDFAMPIRVGARASWQTIEPTTSWKTMKTPIGRNDFDVATDLYYVNVTKQ